MAATNYIQHGTEKLHVFMASSIRDAAARFNQAKAKSGPSAPRRRQAAQLGQDDLASLPIFDARCLSAPFLSLWERLGAGDLHVGLLGQGARANMAPLYARSS